MLSSKKTVLKRIIRGIVVAIIIYLTVSILTTKVIYDSVFQRYHAENPQNSLAEINDPDVTKTSFSYPCNDHLLKGALYSDGFAENGLIVFAPGFKSELIEYEGIFYAFLQEGFDVFSFDPTGHGNSEGKSAVGFPQIIMDLDSTLEFINNNDAFQYNDIFLFGYSQGGYGACCVLRSHSNITAVVSVNSVNTSMDAIMAQSTKYVGPIAYGNYPFLSLYQNTLFGAELSESSAVESINESDTPVLIVQAKEDEHIPKDKYSLYSKREKITSENTEFLLYNKEGFDGHTTILHGENGKPNYDIVKKASAFYIKKSTYEEY